MTRNSWWGNSRLWKFWLNNQVLLSRKLRRYTSTQSPMKNYCQTVYYCVNTFLFCFTSNCFIISIIKTNVPNDSMVDFEFDLHCHLINSQLWLNKTLWLMIWYMTPQSNRWHIIILWIKKLLRDQMYINIYLCYAVGCCVTTKNGWGVMCARECFGILKHRHYIVHNPDPKSKLRFYGRTETDDNQSYHLKLGRV